MPLTYDKWIPSVLLLTHYLPDDPEPSQWINLASLVLGQNGIWGDLLQVSDEGIERVGVTLSRYKQVRNDVTSAALVRTGAVEGSPEICEKIDPGTGRGVVSIFASAAGTYSYVTCACVAPGVWHNEGIRATLDERGHAVVEAAFAGPGAKLILFGIKVKLSV